MHCARRELHCDQGHQAEQGNPSHTCRQGCDARHATPSLEGCSMLLHVFAARGSFAQTKQELFVLFYVTSAPPVFFCSAHSLCKRTILFQYNQRADHHALLYSNACFSCLKMNMCSFEGEKLMFFSLCKRALGWNLGGLPLHATDSASLVAPCTTKGPRTCARGPGSGGTKWVSKRKSGLQLLIFQEEGEGGQ